VARISSPRPASRSRDARVERTLNALRGALLRLLEGQSFDEITIRDICASSGAGYATFFRHYPDKAALLTDLAAVGISELLARALPILFADDTRAACVTLCSYVDERRQLWSTLLTGGAAANLREEFVRQARLVAVENAKVSPPSKRKGSRLPADLAVVFGVSGMIEILAWWLLQHRRELPIEEVAAILDRLVVAPIMQSDTLDTPLRPVPRPPVTKRKKKAAKKR
jgi:AcrR family transcriptional regulator